MAANEEIELKLRVDPEQLSAIRRSDWWCGLGEGRRKSLHGIYFDTPDCRLRDLGMVLRIRLDGKSIVQTVKRGGEGSHGFVRSEWEALVPDAVPDPSLVIDPSLPPEYRKLTSLDVAPAFDVKVSREIRRLTCDGTDIELAVDTGTISSKGRSADVSEIELELVSGDPARLFDEARRINDIAPTRLHLRTKSEVGYDLQEGEEKPWSKGKMPKLSRDMTAGDALSAIIGACLQHLTANDTCARTNCHKEGVHQSRVALRRMHSAFKIFEGALADGALTPLSDEARWCAKAMGPARDLDVLQSELLAPVAAAPEGAEGISLLTSRAKEMEADAYRAVEDALSSARYGRLLIDLCAFGQIRDWEASPGSTSNMSMPAVAFAEQSLSALHKKLMKRGRKFEKLSTDDRHRVRIAVKKMRYAVEFFGDLFDGKQRRRYSKRLARLQDDLGHLNDVVMAESMLDLLVHATDGDGGEPSEQRKLAVAAGQVLGWHQRTVREFDKRLVKDWYAFAETKPFWARKK